MELIIKWMLKGDSLKLKRNRQTYIISIAIPLITGVLASIITLGQMQIYKTLIKPPLSPPAIIFPIVWTILYVLMGISSAMIALTPANKKEQRFAITLYIMQLALNFLWSIVFFNFRAFKASFVIIVMLWYTIFRMILAFMQVNKSAALLQIPYLLWVTFATYLNLAIVLLN